MDYKSEQELKKITLDKNLNVDEKLLYFYLHLQSVNGKPTPSNEELMEVLGITEVDLVEETLESLKAKGYIR